LNPSRSAGDLSGSLLVLGPNWTGSDEAIARRIVTARDWVNGLLNGDDGRSKLEVFGYIVMSKLVHSIE
jgi:hypothetical protein